MSGLTLNRRSRPTMLAALFASLALFAAACGGGGSEGSGSGDGEAEGGETTAEEATAEETTEEEMTAEETTEEEMTTEEDGGGDGGGGTITFASIGWQENIAVNNLWKAILEDEGYTVEFQQADVAPLFEGLSQGSVDYFTDAWLPFTHKQYWEEHSDSLTKVTQWLDEAPLTWAVPAYVDEQYQSIEDLQGSEAAEYFGGEIVGIESGSGLMTASRDNVMPDYNLSENWELTASSTASMLSSLERAISNEEPIVVTLWRPHPAYKQFDLRDLEDPENSLGDPDQLFVVANQESAEEFSEVTDMMSNFKLTQEQIAGLEAAIEDAGEGSELEGAQEWISNNQDLVDEWTSGGGSE